MSGPLRVSTLFLVVLVASVGAGCANSPAGDTEPRPDSAATTQPGPSATTQPSSSGTNELPSVSVEYVGNESRIDAVPDHLKANYSELTATQKEEFDRALHGSTRAGSIAYLYQFVEYRGDWYEVQLIED